MKSPIFFALLTVGLAGCATFNRCKTKFGGTFTDTVRVQQTVRLTLPRDSAVISLVNDTTTVIREVTSHRARVIVQKTRDVIHVRAVCDTVFLEKTVEVKTPTVQNWGVSPNWKYATYGLGGAVLLAFLLLLVVLLLRR